MKGAGTHAQGNNSAHIPWNSAQETKTYEAVAPQCPRYKPRWTIGTSEYRHTTSTTHIKGAKFTFSFAGTPVKVLGTLANRPFSVYESVFPNTSYTVDGGDSVLFLGKPGNDILYNQPFFFSGNLPYDNHTIVGTCVDDGSQVYIDYLVVEAPTPESIPSPPVSITWTHSQPATPTRLLATESSSLSGSITSPYTLHPSRLSLVASLEDSPWSPSCSPYFCGTVIGREWCQYAIDARFLFLRAASIPPHRVYQNPTRRSQVTPVAACLIVGSLVVWR
ncbi:hypothetical protein BDN71DRAFT_1498178 [Pleurotus eryngii]|uniref:Uncharacterized protein n=1 Tax=Pleurotus eryngii TaxID=5323 RepID=A0A9P5ZQY9_PLEER|nr:hypothetical protein BDN71DRAFT_1498178 [Pleurotus eryngii]